ncbi:13517_t:CDS:2, partial [Gigaspora margarita]
QISSSHQDYTITLVNSLETIPKGSDELMQVEIVQRKVKTLLNKLAMEKFDSISDQIIDYANKSRFERDGCILKEVIRLIFEQFCDEPNFSKLLAQLCRKIMEKIDHEIVDENLTNSNGKFVQGGTLFRKYLLNRCQEEFEKGNIPVPSIEKDEPDLMSDEYFIVAKTKRYHNGFMRFIGELFKLKILTERIMHKYIKKLLTIQNGVHEEDEIENLCKLITTAGQQLDHTKAKSHMDAYFFRMEDISKNSKFDKSEELRNINNIVEKYFNIVDMNEVILFIKELPKEFYSKVIEIFANKALEKKQDDVDRVILLFNKLTIDNIVDKSIFIRGFTATIEFLIDIRIDVPKSGQLFCAARLDFKDVSDLLKPLLKIDDNCLAKIMAGYMS